MVFLYQSYELAANTLKESWNHGIEATKYTFTPALPEYYIPVCLLIGGLCLGIGVCLIWKEHRGPEKHPEFLTLNIN